MRLRETVAKFMPMKFIEYRFTDCVSGNPINLYVQTDGVTVLAESRFSFFRVPLECQRKPSEHMEA